MTQPQAEALPVSDEDIETYHKLQGIINGEFNNAEGSLMTTTLADGTPVTMVVAIMTDGDTYDIEPLAILVSDAVMAMLNDPTDQ